MIMKILFCILGVLFFLLGLIGLVLPVIPQIPFFAASALFLMAGSNHFAAWFTGTEFYKKYLEKRLKGSRRLSRFLNNQ